MPGRLAAASGMELRFHEGGMVVTYADDAAANIFLEGQCVNSFKSRTISMFREGLRSFHAAARSLLSNVRSHQSLRGNTGYQTF